MYMYKITSNNLNANFQRLQRPLKSLPICMYVCMYVGTHVYTYVCMFMCMYVCIYVCMYVCIYVCMHVYMCVCVYVCMYACMYVCMYVRTCALQSVIPSRFLSLRPFSEAIQLPSHFSFTSFKKSGPSKPSYAQDDVSGTHEVLKCDKHELLVMFP